MPTNPGTLVPRANGSRCGLACTNLDSEVKAKISTPLAKLKPTGSCTVDVAEENSNYTIAKYNKDSRATYGLKFDNSIKKFNRKTSYTDVTGNSVSGEVTLVNNEKLITFTGDADDSGVEIFAFTSESRKLV